MHNPTEALLRQLDAVLQELNVLGELRGTSTREDLNQEVARVVTKLRKSVEDLGTELMVLDAYRKRAWDLSPRLHGAIETVLREYAGWSRVMAKSWLKKLTDAVTLPPGPRTYSKPPARESLRRVMELLLQA